MLGAPEDRLRRYLKALSSATMLAGDATIGDGDRDYLVRRKLRFGGFSDMRLVVETSRIGESR